ncbi:MAG: hypothetical protein IPJ41_17805 [Phycisphaerales bacterium]|nr:hypothetical protein [Phycisphaerales bacterium]
MQDRRVNLTAAALRVLQGRAAGPAESRPPTVQQGTPAQVLTAREFERLARRALGKAKP